jgi:hypothetical protein
VSPLNRICPPDTTDTALITSAKSITINSPATRRGRSHRQGWLTQGQSKPPDFQVIVELILNIYVGDLASGALISYFRSFGTRNSLISSSETIFGHLSEIFH